MEDKDNIEDDEVSCETGWSSEEEEEEGITSEGTADMVGCSVHSTTMCEGM